MWPAKILQFCDLLQDLFKINERWREHFSERLNYQQQENVLSDSELETREQQEEIQSWILNDIITAVKELRNSRNPEIDNIEAELVKYGRD